MQIESMMDKRIREVILAVGAFGLLAAAVMLWQRQSAIDLPQPEPARPLTPLPPTPQPLLPSLPPPDARATPATSPGTWFSDADYPAEAIRNGWHGTAAFRLTIDGMGQVAQCAITASTGHAVLDEATCRLLTARARFTPARTASGVAAADSYNGRITWRLPE